jgi:hypothetical protein
VLLGVVLQLPLLGLPPPVPLSSTTTSSTTTIAANGGMIEASMVAAGFHVNTPGGSDEHGKAGPLQDKDAVAHKYFEL